MLKLKQPKQTQILKMEFSVDNIISYLIIGLIFTELCLKGIKSNDVIEYENSKIFQELVKRPEQYVNNVIKFNLEYLEIKLNCVNYINETTVLGLPMSQKTISTIKDIKKIMKIVEKLLLGIMDILDVKLYLDEHMLNNSKHYDRLVITSEDIKSYKELEETYNEVCNIIYNNYKMLSTLCKPMKQAKVNANAFVVSNFVNKENGANSILDKDKIDLEDLEYKETLEYIKYLEEEL